MLGTLLPRILDQGLVQVADIAAGDQLAFLSSLLHPDLDAGTAKHVACIIEADAHGFGNLDLLPIFGNLEKAHCLLGILDRIDGSDFAASSALGLAVAPLRLHLLDMCAVVEHDLAQICGCLGRPDIPTKSFFG